MRLKLLPVLLLLVIAPLSGHGEDLMEAYQQAIANDPVLSTADATRLAVAEGVPQARSALLPQLSAGLSFDQSHGGVGGSNIVNGVAVPTSAEGHSRYRDLNGSLSQAIINLPDIATLQAAHSTSDAQDETYRAALQNLYVRVANAYFNVLIAQDQVDVNQAYEDGYKQEFEQTSQRLKVGLENSANATQAQAFYLSIKSERISAQDTLKDALRALEQITGHPTGTLKKLREDIPLQAPTPNDPKAWVAAAMETNPAILSARFTVSADEHKIWAARAGHLPTLSSVAGLTARPRQPIPVTGQPPPPLDSRSTYPSSAVVSRSRRCARQFISATRIRAISKPNDVRPRAMPTTISTWWLTASIRWKPTAPRCRSRKSRWHPCALATRSAR